MIERLSFVYDADGTFVGEVKYYLGALVGLTHCSLCDITHTKVGKRKSFQSCATALGIPIDYYHRNDVPSNVATAAAEVWPAVIGHHHDGTLTVALDRAALGCCNGDVTAFEAALRAALVR